MKALSAFLLLFLASVLSAAPGEVGMRVDVIGSEKLEADPGTGVSLSRRTRRVNSELIQELMFCKTVVSGTWTPFEFSFMPVKTATVTLSLRGNNVSEGQPPVFHVDAISVIGAELKNPSFEELNKNGGLLFWNSGPERVAANVPDAKDGKNYARVSYDRPLVQKLDVTAGKRVRVTLWIRQENESRPVAPEGTNVYFDLKFGSKVVISSGRLELRPTFENCSVYVNRTQAERGKKIELKLFYRETGKKEWIRTLDPVNMEREHAWRGSILLLRENTPYEVKCEISGEVSDTFTGSFRTLNSRVPVAKEIVLDPATFSGTLTQIESGAPDGYVRYTMRPGVLKGEKFFPGAVINAENARYVIFDGLKIIANGARHGLRLADCENIIVRNCDISDFGRTDDVRDYHQLGRWTYAGNITGWDGGIFIRGGTNQLIERSYIHSPRSTSNSWLYSHPTGPEAIFVDRAAGGLVIRYNDFVGSDKRRWNDAIEGVSNASVDGGFGRDADVYGNLFAFSNDDSLEIEGGEMNIRVYFNRFEGSFCGVSTGSCRLGPSYQFRNLYFRLGDENGRSGNVFKNGMGVQGDGAIFILNNTVFSPNTPYSVGDFHSRPPEYSPPLKAFLRNNILMGEIDWFLPGVFKWNVDADYDLLYGGASKSGSRALLVKLGKERNAIFAEPRFANLAAADFNLAVGSPGRDSAAPLPGLTVRHRGAFQEDPVTTLPYRPLAVTASVNELHFSDENAPIEKQFSVSAPAGFRSTFKVECNDDFFTVTPSSGELKDADRIQFTVRLDPARMPKPQLYRGMALIRFSDGFSRPVSIYADYRNSASRQEEALKHAIVIPSDYRSGERKTYEVEIPEDGCYFLLAAGRISGKSIVEVRIGNEKTGETARFIEQNSNAGKDRLGIVCGSSLSAWYFHLKKGRQQLTFQATMPGLEIEKFYLTREPEWFLY